MIVVAYAIAFLLPLFFLYLIYSQDIFGQGKFRNVLFAFAWGLVAFGGAYFVNGWLYRLAFDYYDIRLSAFGAGEKATMLVYVLFAPVAEETLKSLILLYLGRRMTYFVDGAIYGFASGIAFSILENFFYLGDVQGAGTAGLLALMRALSTCLVHGSASGLVGTAVGRFRYGRGWRRVISTILGGSVAIGLHMGFNRLVRAADPSFLTLLGAVGVGVGGAVLIILFIRWGLAEEKKWIEETLNLAEVGVTRQEVAIVQQYERIDDLLEEVLERYGFPEDKVEPVATFLLKQGQLGIKRKTRTMSQDPREREKLGEEIAALQEEMERIRKQVGAYWMMSVRMLIPESFSDTYASLTDRLVDRETYKGEKLEDKLAARVVQREGSQEQLGGMWGRLGQVSGKSEEE